MNIKVQETPTGRKTLSLPKNIAERFGWDKGDLVEIIENADGSITYIKF